MVRESPELMEIYFLDVGQGDCTVIVLPDDSAIVFDVGDQRVLERFMANHRLGIRAVIASHLDIDHVRGMLGFLRSRLEAGESVDRLYIGLDRRVLAHGHKTLRALVKQAIDWSRQKPPPIIVKDPWRDLDGPLIIAEGDDWAVKLVLPFNTSVMQAQLEGGQAPNVCSAVLRVERGNTAVLIGSDAPIGAWEQLEGELLPAKVLRVPHHGGNILEPANDWRTFEDLHDRVGADLGIISVGTKNQYGHPRVDHAHAIRRAGSCRLLCTQLTPRCHPNPRALRAMALEHATEVEPTYRHQKSRDEVPCAGTIAVFIDKSGQVEQLPSRESISHRKFLQNVNAPLCQISLPGLSS